MVGLSLFIILDPAGLLDYRAESDLTKVCTGFRGLYGQDYRYFDQLKVNQNRNRNGTAL